MHGDLVRRAFELFRTDLQRLPSVTLRAGNALDDYDEPPPYDPVVDEPNDAYLERYAFWGLNYLDAASWRHYLPRLIDYALRHLRASRAATQGLLSSLRPPDRVPPWLGSLTPEEEALIRDFLEVVAFGDDANSERELAMQALEEWWLPNALYRRDT